MTSFPLFVVPFCLGVVLLVVFSVWKYVRWIRQFSKKQHLVVRKNIFSLKFVPALWEMFREGLLHWRIAKKNWLLGYMHRSLAFGWFLLIVVGAVQARLAFPHGHPFYEAIFFNYFESRANEDFQFAYTHFFSNLMDLLLLYVFSGLGLAVLKKFWSRPLGMKKTTKHSLIDRIAKATLWCIFPIRLLSESITAALYGNGGFLVVGIGRLLGSTQLPLALLEYPCWLLYSVDVGLFFALMPFSRYMHIFTEPLLIYFRQLGVREGENKSGYTLFELSACARCGICIDGCPVNRELGITDTQGVDLLKALRNKEVFRKAEDIAESCMMCGRCAEDCPVKIDLPAIRRQVRVQDKRGVDRSGNYNYLQFVQPFNAIGRVAYFGGCMSKLTPGITESMVAIFEAAHQPYWWMDREYNICCGRPLLQQGFANQALELRNKNAALIAQSGATALVTSCPICYQSFVKEYHLSIPVLHHTEYIEMLLKSGAIKVRRDDSLRMAYHDPCELGRGCGIYDAPRNVVKEAGVLLKTQEERNHSLCCGFNLGNTSIDVEQQTLIRNAARDNLLREHPEMIVTACPMCKKAFGHADDVPVKDVAEIIAERLV